MTVDTIITHATVLTGTTRPAAGYPALPAEDTAARGTATFLPDHAIGITAGEIAWVLPTGEVDPVDLAGATVLDAGGQVAVPGLVNTHTHSPMTMFRGSAEDVPTASWFNEHIWPMEVNLTERDVTLGARLAVGEMLLAGVTSFADHYFMADRIAEVVADSGARALLASTYFSSQGTEGIARSAEFAERWNGAADGRITTAMGPHATYTVDDADLEATAEHARRLGVRVHVHAAESMSQTRSSLARRGVTPVQVLHDTGVLEAGAIIAHGTGIIEDDLRWLTPFADRVAVASCSKVYLKHAHSETPVRMLHDAGITVGVGTDGPASNNTLDVLESMRVLSLVQKMVHADATWLTSAHALDLATRQSAAALGLGDRLGAIQPGFRADVVLLDLDKPHLQPMHDLAAALVLSVRASDVTTVLVEGRVVVRDGALTTMDLTDTIAELNARLPGLTDTAHGRTIQDYAP
ncbi:amidohydrolase [Modestobacter roseus]|uniref:5-methylthioadenosine/S-adenosylhomocysteine deaminase n=1 Tax=Modestobacter roseus TaxID=1181884 RepID=A0A562IPG8_9ACTN|nr:amidohydrolase [Modestobacter roseus]MQA35397.1 amidohydrolase family protein [Modestobacter roseus]TWH72792.1 5-methylthioadenosine/S-adenosylhomocysteine deaminase [Modestobacter roseus]